MHRHHRVEEEGEVDTLGLAGKLKRRAIPVEGKGTFDGGCTDGCFVGAAE